MAKGLRDYARTALSSLNVKRLRPSGADESWFCPWRRGREGRGEGEEKRDIELSSSWEGERQN